MSLTVPVIRGVNWEERDSSTYEERVSTETDSHLGTKDHRDIPL